MARRMDLPCSCAIALLYIQVLASGEGQTLLNTDWKSEPKKAVSQAPIIYSAPGNSSLLKPTNVDLECAAMNEVTHFHWKKNGIRLDPIPDKVLFSQENDRYKLLIIDAGPEDSGIYECSAENQYGATQSAPAFVDIVEDPMDSSFDSNGYHSNQGQCMNYSRHASLCSQVLNRSLPVFVSSLGQLRHMEAMLTATIKILDQSMSVSKECYPYILPLLCIKNFPYCDPSASYPKRLYFCYKDCWKLRHGPCMVEYRFIVKKDESDLIRLLPDCPELQNHLRSGGPCVSQEVSSSGAENPNKMAVITTASSCYIGNGSDHAGSVQVSRSGTPCLPWNVSKEYEGMKHNYCRNPLGSATAPWCFIQKNGIAKELCDISKCQEEAVLDDSDREDEGSAKGGLEMVHGRTVTNGNTSSRFEVINLTQVLGPCLVVALLFSLSVVLFCWRRSRRLAVHLPFSELAPLKLFKVPSIKVDELNPEEVNLEAKIGDWTYGPIYDGLWKSSSKNHVDPVKVVVKVLVDTTRRAEFYREAEMRAVISHTNVARLCGAVLTGKPRTLVFESTDLSNLHAFLLLNSPHFTEGKAASAQNCEALCFGELVDISSQVAAGMSYLSGLGFVHRDLAARNCNIDSKGTVKIVDWNGCHALYQGDYHPIPNRGPLPVRWMAPESILQDVFTSKSDVWSAGVLFWEVFAYGELPHFGISNAQAIEAVLDSRLLLPPTGCPAFIYNLMKECWMLDPDARPHFRTVHAQLQGIKTRPTRAGRRAPLSSSSTNASLTTEPLLPRVETLHGLHIGTS